MPGFRFEGFGGFARAATGLQPRTAGEKTTAGARPLFQLEQGEAGFMVCQTKYLRIDSNSSNWSSHTLVECKEESTGNMGSPRTE